MRAVTAVICDQIHRAEDGRPTLFGIRDLFLVPALPATIQFGLYLEFAAAPGDTDATLSVRVLPRGWVGTPDTVSVALLVPEETFPGGELRFTFDYDLRFVAKRARWHDVVVLLDGVEAIRVPFAVVLQEAGS